MTELYTAEYMVEKTTEALEAMSVKLWYSLPIEMRVWILVELIEGISMPR